MLRLRCGNLEEDNKYWLEEEKRKRVFCGVGKDNMRHFIRRCEMMKGWFKWLGLNEKERYRGLWRGEIEGEKGMVEIVEKKEKRMKEKRKEDRKGGEEDRRID